MPTIPVVTLLPPIIEKKCITKDQYGTIPKEILFIANNYPQIHLVTITPQKSTDSGHCRVTMIVPANLRDGNLMLQNNGRVPITSPPMDQDDLRPISFYAFGTGTQLFKVVLSNNPNNYVQSMFTI